MPPCRRSSGRDAAHTPQLLLFGENWEDDDGFSPDHLVDVTDGFAAWREAVHEYELARGLSSFPYVDYYSALYRTARLPARHAIRAGLCGRVALLERRGRPVLATGRREGQAMTRVLAIDLGGTNLRAALYAGRSVGARRCSRMRRHRPTARAFVDRLATH